MSNCIGGFEDLCLGSLDTVYPSLGLAIVCDDYLVISLETLCHHWNMPNHVAGASFMAFGSAAPEIIFNMITTLRGKDSIELGVSTILGSGYIAFLVIPSLCALSAAKRLVIEKSVTIRDCLGYLIVLGWLCYIIKDGDVVLYESIVLILMFMVYMLVVFFPMYRTKLGFKPEVLYIPKSVRIKSKEEIINETTPLIINNNRKNNKKNDDYDNLLSDRHRTLTKPEIYHYPHDIHHIIATGESYSSESDIDSDDDDDDIDENSIFQSIPVQLVSWPLYTAFKYTCPDCHIGSEKHPNPNEKYYIITFITSFIWIALFSTVVAACVDRWVSLSGVSMNLFGLCVVALSAEIPDTIQSVAVAKRGHGSMAVSNCLGTQIINITFGLGVPWLLANIFKPNDNKSDIEVYFPDPLALELTASLQVINVCIYFMLILGWSWIMNTKYAYLTKFKAMILCIVYVVAISSNYFLINILDGWLTDNGYTWHHVHLSS